MKILLLIPGMDESCDNAHAYIHMQKSGAKIEVITNRVRSTKGPGIDPPYSNMNGIGIHRIFWDFNEQVSFSDKGYRQVYDFARCFRPDVVFCSQQKNMHLAKRLKKHLNVPIVLLVEYAYNQHNPFRLIGKRHLFKYRLVRAIAAKIYWQWLCKHSSAIITCYHGDVPNFSKLSSYNTPLFYVPWPAAPTINPDEVARNRGRGVYVGALNAHKNIQEFEKTLPLIFENTPTAEFFIVGSGNSQQVVNKLKTTYPSNLLHIPSLSRFEALKLIASSFYSYTPALYGGWGLFGDSWSMKTPIVCTHNDYALVHRHDSLLCIPEEISYAINQLYNDQLLYENITQGGYDRFSKWHKAETVGDKYLEIINSVLMKG